MIDKRSISAYTPSNTDPETRERIFVQRRKLLGRVVRWCEESMLTGNKHHLLFIGPRGSGKTHLVAMAHDRLSKNPKLSDKMRVAWLGEDSVFTGLIDFALEIADELSNEYPDEFGFDYRDKARPLSADDAAELILDEIVSRLGDKSILLIMENLDRAFRGLGDLGQKKWRAFLQENTRVATLATSQQLFEDISSRHAAFYGFFEIVHLEPLSVDDARALMAKIACENGKHDLVQFLATPEGRYRVRALHHLAGGNHRMYVMLSEFLTKESLDGLVVSFEELAEDLTPYFQERVRSLSPQQARIVQSLCNATGAMTVKEISEDAFISDRNVSRQLGDLKQKGYVISERRGKESFYEMAEPLMRLCLEVKKQRGKPLKLVVAFLRAWYSAKSLQGEFEGESGIAANNPRSLAYREAALSTDDAFRQIIGRKLSQEFDSKLEGNDFDDAMNIAEELVCADRPTGLIRKSQVFRKRGRFAQALDELDRVVSSPGLTAGQRTEALRNRGITYGMLGESGKAIADCSAVIEMEEAPVDHRAGALLVRGIIYGELGESKKEIADYSVVVEMERAAVKPKAMALVNRGYGYGQIGESEKAIADYSAVIEMEEAPLDERATALVHRGITYGEIGESEKAIADCSAVIKMEEAPAESKARALVGRGDRYWHSQQFAPSLNDFMVVASMTGVSSSTRTNALFRIPEAMIPIKPLDESLESIQRAFAEGDPEASGYGGTPRHILRMIIGREHHSWAEFVERLIPIYAEYGAISTLSSGLTQSTGTLDAGGYSESQLDLWNSSWQEFGAKHDELSIALSALDAAVQVIKTGNDRPLFDLPLEIRELVRPLLENTLSRK